MGKRPSICCIVEFLDKKFIASLVVEKVADNNHQGNSQYQADDDNTDRLGDDHHDTEDIGVLFPDPIFELEDQQTFLLT